MANLSTQPYKGTRDFFPSEMALQKWIFNRMRESVENFGYLEYNGPMLEPFELYAAKTGEEIVNQQLYWMIDRGERKMAVRPEMTPTLARMVAQKQNELPKPIRWYSIPNVWRYERPQKGRLREHWQLNVDILGGDPLLADAELLSVALGVIRDLGGIDSVSLRINNRHLMDFIFQKQLGLNAESALKVVKAIDARAKTGEESYQKLVLEAGVSKVQFSELEEFFKMDLGEVVKKYDCAGSRELESLFALLAESGFKPGKQFCFDPLILRGLDYYTGTVFELYDISPENRRAMFGGGRYDNLVGMFEGKPLSGVGFGMGDVTAVNFLEIHGLLPKLDFGPQVFVSLPHKSSFALSQRIADSIRARGIRTVVSLEEGGFGAQIKQANRLQARFIVLFGEDEMTNHNIVLKDLLKSEQSTVNIDDLPNVLGKLVQGVE